MPMYREDFSGWTETQLADRQIDLSDKSDAATLAELRLIRAEYDRRKATTNGTPTAPPAVETPPANGLRLMTADEWEADNPPANYLVDRLLLEGENGIINGPPKSLKSALLGDLVFSVASGTPFLGRYLVPAPRRVLAIVNEGQRQWLPRLRAVAKARGRNLGEIADMYRLAKRTINWEQISLESAEHIKFIRDAVEQFQPGLVVFDSAYRAFSGDNMGNRSHMAKFLSQLDDVSAATKTAFLLSWHSNKTEYRIPEFNDISWAGCDSWMRHWLLVNRKCDYRGGGVHQLWLKTGNSNGDGDCFCLEVNEGTKEPSGEWSTWETQLLAAKPKDKTKGPTATNDELDAVVAVLEQHAPAAANKIATVTGWRKSKVARVLGYAVETGLLVEKNQRYEVTSAKCPA